MSGWMMHKLKSRLQEELSITSTEKCRAFKFDFHLNVSDISHFPFSCTCEFIYTYTLILVTASIFPIKITVHIIHGNHKCVPGPLCNTFIELTITNTFNSSTVLNQKKKKFCISIHYEGNIQFMFYCMKSIVCQIERV